MLRAVKIGLPIVVVLLVVIYGLVSYMIVSGIAKVDRTEQEDHPSNYDLPYDDVDFAPRFGELALSPRLNSNRGISMTPQSRSKSGPRSLLSTASTATEPGAIEWRWRLCCSLEAMTVFSLT